MFSLILAHTFLLCHGVGAGIFLFETAYNFSLFGSACFCWLLTRLTTLSSLCYAEMSPRSLFLFFNQSPEEEFRVQFMKHQLFCFGVGFTSLFWSFLFLIFICMKSSLGLPMRHGFFSFVAHREFLRCLAFRGVSLICVWLFLLNSVSLLDTSFTVVLLLSTGFFFFGVWGVDMEAFLGWHSPLY